MTFEPQMLESWSKA